MVRLRRFSKSLLSVGIIATGVSKLREKRFVEIKYRDNPFSPLLVFPVLSTADRNENMSAPEPESFGFQAEISQLLDLIISGSCLSLCN